ncbi:hypothetical protein ACFL1I_06375 [Candidatus Omnitrophota bacterium]
MKIHKKSFGVILTGWALIVLGIGSLIHPLLNFQNFKHNFFDLYHSSLQLVWVISTAILIGYVVGGFKILRQEEFGKSLVVFLAIIDIPHLVVGRVIYSNLGLQPLYLRNASLITAGIIINLVLIHFLNHPKVRKQFS